MSTGDICLGILQESPGFLILLRRSIDKYCAMVSAAAAQQWTSRDSASHIESDKITKIKRTTPEKNSRFSVIWFASPQWFPCPLICHLVHWLVNLCIWHWTNISSSGCPPVTFAFSISCYILGAGKSPFPFPFPAFHRSRAAAQRCVVWTQKLKTWQPKIRSEPLISIPHFWFMRKFSRT